MADNSTSENKESGSLVVKSSRFGEIAVPESSVIELPSGIIGFPTHKKFVLIDYKPPFSWLHSVEDQDLAFVVVDGFQFGDAYGVKPPIGDKDCDITESDEYALLVLITVSSDPKETTANLKAPVFINIRTKKGLQVIYDDPRFSTRFPLWGGELKPAGAKNIEKTESE